MMCIVCVRTYYIVWLKNMVSYLEGETGPKSISEPYLKDEYFDQRLRIVNGENFTTTQFMKIWCIAYLTYST
jgi:hypothetical protein